MIGGQLVTDRGGDHALTMREPVLANLLIQEFAESLGLRPQRSAAPAAPHT